MKFKCLHREKVFIADVILSLKLEVRSSTVPTVDVGFQSCEVNHRPKAVRRDWEKRRRWRLIERFSKHDATSTQTSFNREGSESRTPPRRKQNVI